MDSNIQSRLLELNRNFYNRFASSFSDTRGRVQPGVRQIIKRMDLDSSILDVGCGNGTLARALVENGYNGDYLGVDMSEELLTKAQTLLDENAQGHINFQQIDLADLDWQNAVPTENFDWLVSFAVFHHLPGQILRRNIASAFADLVAQTGKVAVSVWQWQNSPRLSKRVLPWDTVGLDPAKLDKGDVLLDWRAGETVGYRYVHTFTENSLTELAQDAGFTVRESFYSDGKTGDLALYQVWQLP